MAEAEAETGASPARRRRRSRPPSRLALHEVFVQTRVFWRNPMQTAFIVVLPVILVPMLDALNPDVRVLMPPASPHAAGDLAAGGPLALVPYDQYLVPALAAFGVMTACFATLALRVTVAREDGVLKRLRGTPLPPWAHLVGRIGASVLIALLVAAATVAVGVAFYDVDVIPRLLPAAVLTTALAAGCFCALGLAATTALPTAESAPAIVFAIVFPLAFISEVFFPPQLAPAWMDRLGAWLPLQPYARAMAAAFNPAVHGTGLQWRYLGVLAAWTGAGAIVAVRWFAWSPRHESRQERWTSLTRRPRHSAGAR
jgi:ABC-type multidrug transport system permease subunit